MGTPLILLIETSKVSVILNSVHAERSVRQPLLEAWISVLVEVPQLRYDSCLFHGIYNNGN